MFTTGDHFNHCFRLNASFEWNDRFEEAIKTLAKLIRGWRRQAEPHFARRFAPEKFIMLFRQWNAGFVVRQPSSRPLLCDKFCHIFINGKTRAVGEWNKNRLNKLLRYRLTPLALVCALGLSAGAQAGAGRRHHAGQRRRSGAGRRQTAQRHRGGGHLGAAGIFNPYLFTNGWDENVTDVIFSRLIGWTAGANRKGARRSPAGQPDNLTYTIKLRPNLLYSDGSPLKADDIAFTLTLLHDPAYDGDTDITPAHRWRRKTAPPPTSAA